MNVAQGPWSIIWDITYACPLRCVHCYSESGRRPTRQLRDAEEILRVVDAFIALKPKVVSLAGGEPLLIKNILEVAGKLREAGISTCIYTSGWRIDESTPARLAEVFNQVAVSVDGPDAGLHDRIRGRAGSFERAMNALRLLNEEAERRARAGEKRLNFTAEYVVLRSNFDRMEEFAEIVSARFPYLASISFNAAAPSGLGSTLEFGRTELLHDDEMAQLASGEFRARLQDRAGDQVRVFSTDNLALVGPPDPLAEVDGSHVMQVEPDGEVRWMPSCEGSVGNLLTEDPYLIWARAKKRWRDPFVVGTLSPVRTVRQWAQAVHVLNDRFCADTERPRVQRLAKGMLPLTVTSS
jgi:MoaA/NifB/PqqE/SkfB family radical SAM enzyme